MSKERLTSFVSASWGLTRETAATVVAFELYPLGALGQRPPHLPIRFPGSARRQTPVLFIHGIFHNASAFAYLKQRLALGGWRTFGELNLFTSVHSIPKLAAKVAREVDRLIDRTGNPYVDIIAHSMGGIVARYFVQLLAGEKKVRNLITLGTPHQGTPWSRYSVLPHVRELKPDSRLLAELNRQAAPQNTQALSIFGNLDFFIRPKKSGWWEGVRNVELKNVGHAGVLFSRRVFRLITTRLK